MTVRYVGGAAPEIVEHGVSQHDPGAVTDGSLPDRDVCFGALLREP
jgi:hypothetical protein